MSQKKDSKRILSVTVIRAIDTDPDTSYYGEYSSTRTSEYSIDRAHSEDCQTVNQSGRDAIDQIERVIAYLEKQRLAPQSAGLTPTERATISEAQDIMGQLQDDCYSCDCGERGDMLRGEYRYFNPSSNYVDDNGNLVDGNTPEEVRKYVAQDYARMEDYNKQGWSFTGTYARAEVQTSLHSTIQTIRSGGLWGTESDSDDSHFAEIEKEELATLRHELEAIGFTKRAVSAAFRNVKHKDE